MRRVRAAEEVGGKRRGCGRVVHVPDFAGDAAQVRELVGVQGVAQRAGVTAALVQYECFQLALGERAGDFRHLVKARLAVQNKAGDVRAVQQGERGYVERAHLAAQVDARAAAGAAQIQKQRRVGENEARKANVQKGIDQASNGFVLLGRVERGVERERHGHIGFSAQPGERAHVRHGGDLRGIQKNLAPVERRRHAVALQPFGGDEPGEQLVRARVHIRVERVQRAQPGHNFHV